jgi:UDP-N-acetylglucosamine--N-acetylmuramyl-(pentapeptide) pyrophosphoryl-undecaprenol N-acetylglucosamine transferase
LPKDAQAVLITGGGNGARQLNHAVVANVRYLLTHYPKLVLFHLTGRAHEAETNQAYDAQDLKAARQRVRVLGFVSDLYQYSGVADVVVARGGATNLAEFAIQAKACLIVPSKQLGWNVKNSQALADRGAVQQLTEDQAEQPERLGRAIGDLLDDAAARQALSERLATFARPDAARELARLLIDIHTGGAKRVRPQ